MGSGSTSKSYTSRRQPASESANQKESPTPGAPKKTKNRSKVETGHGKKKPSAKHVKKSVAARKEAVESPKPVAPQNNSKIIDQPSTEPISVSVSPTTFDPTLTLIAVPAPIEAAVSRYPLARREDAALSIIPRTFENPIEAPERSEPLTVTPEQTQNLLPVFTTPSITEEAEVTHQDTPEVLEKPQTLFSRFLSLLGFGKDKRSENDDELDVLVETYGSLQREIKEAESRPQPTPDTTDSEVELF